MNKIETPADRQRTFKERQRAAGLQQVTIWVPIKRAREIRDLAKKWCTAFLRKRG